MRPAVVVPWWAAIPLAVLSILILVPWAILRIVVELAEAIHEALRHRPT